MFIVENHIHIVCINESLVINILFNNVKDNEVFFVVHIIKIYHKYNCIDKIKFTYHNIYYFYCLGKFWHL